MQPTTLYMHFQKIPNAIMLSIIVLRLMVPLLICLMFMEFGFELNFKLIAQGFGTISTYAAYYYTRIFKKSPMS